MVAELKPAMGGVSVSYQILALLRRNALLKFRNKKQTAAELFVPILVVGFLGLMRMAFSPESSPPVTQFDTVSLKDFNSPSVFSKFYVSPGSEVTRPLVTEILAHLDLSSAPVFYFNSSKSAEDAFRSNASDDVIGLDFQALQRNARYSIRFAQSMVEYSQDSFAWDNRGCRDVDGKGYCRATSYLHSGFASLQTAVETVLMRNMTGDSAIPFPVLSVKQYPIPELKPQLSGLQAMTAIYMIMAYSLFVHFLVVALVSEKENQVKECMRLMGLREAAFWTSWVITYTVIIFTVSLVAAVLAKFTQLLGASSVFIIFLILFLYGMTIITFAFIITPFFNKAESAGSFAGFSLIIFSLLYLAVSFTRSGYNEEGPVSSVPAWGQWAMCLLSPVAMSLAMDQALHVDLAFGGLNFSTINIGQFSVSSALVMMAVDFVLYGMLAVYFDHVIPGKYGPRHPPYFFLMPSYWCNQPPKKRELIMDDDHSVLDIESVPVELENSESMKIFNIHKSFRSKGKVVNAVNGISLEMYEGQITALLGHNGAGKTTLINMLTGAISASSGTATVAGLDVSNAVQLTKIRRMLGVCPQHNVLIPSLTCKEHLDFFGRLRGLGGNELRSQIDQMLEEVDLSSQTDSRACTLSGGQKRKLALAIALIGDPKIIFLDEPTAGMDPSTRRSVWTLLKNRRPKHIILLTTHFMDEADILADRKAIISNGKLRCVGSSLFLKNKFGVGYHLGLVTEGGCSSSVVTTLVQETIPDAAIGRSHGQELVFTLPLTQVSAFPGLFRSIEESIERREHGIMSYGISMTTLEEVFLKIGEEEQEEIKKGDTKSNLVAPSADPVAASEPLASIPAVRISREGLLSRQFRSLFILNIKTSMRIKIVVFFRFVFPVLMLVLGAFIDSLGRKSISHTDYTQAAPEPVSVLPSAYVQNRLQSSALPKISLQGSGGGNVSDFNQALDEAGYELQSFANEQDFFLVAPHHLGFIYENITLASSVIKASVMYNMTAVHSIPSALNLISNTLLSLFSSSPLNVSLLNAPWPDPVNSQVGFENQIIGTGIIIGGALVSPPSGFGVLLVKDREVRASTQIRVAGVGFLVKYAARFCADMAQYSVTGIMSVVVLLAFQSEWILVPGGCVSFVLVLIVFMPVLSVTSYNLSFAFNSFQTCQSVMPQLYPWAGYIPFVAIVVTDLLGETTVAAILHYIFLFINPLYGIFGAIYYISKIYFNHVVENGTKASVDFGEYFDPSNHVIGVILIGLIQLSMQLCLLRILEVKSTSGQVGDALGCPQKKAHSAQLNVTMETEDEDVVAERHRVEQLVASADSGVVSLVRNLGKEFPAPRSQGAQGVKVVVSEMTFAVGEGEVFGLLGPNGAGKSTTLNMMIAEVNPTHGNVVIDGHDISSSVSEAFRSLGFCGQTDALWVNITLREHLEAYATFKGVVAEDVDLLVDFFINSLQLEDHAGKASQKLSGGTKRKLSYAISMLGNPKVVLLDEPSTGMDPKSKRFLWDTISGSFEGRERGAILTTHYMEEADALCSRVAIMVNGRLQALGTTQHLKNKYGTGYVLEVKLTPSASVQSLQSFVDELFSTVILSEKFGERFTFKISQESIGSLSKVFEALEHHRESLGIEEYSFSQSTLEQVFLELAKHQKDETTDGARLLKEEPLPSVRL